MNILKRELKANIKPLVIWSVCVGLLLFLSATEFRVYQGQAGEINKILDSLPEIMKQAFSLDGLRLDVPEGYYGFLAGYLMLMACIYAALAGAQILSKEINKKTAETTFTLPVTRRQVISLKLLAVLINCVLLTAVIFLGSLVAFAAPEMSPVFVGRVFLYMLFILLMQLLFVLAGLCISVLIKSHKRAGTMVASLTIGTYFLSFMANMGSKTEFLKYFTPFEYFPSVDVINSKNLESFGFVIAPVLILTFFFMSYGLVAKKDI